MATQPILKKRHYLVANKMVNRNSRDFSFTAGLEKALAKTLLTDTALPIGPAAAPSLISSAHGRIEEILLTIPDYVFLNGGQNGYWKVYKDLIKKLPGYTSIIVVIQENVLSEFENWIQTEQLDITRFRITTLPEHVNFSVWAEDAYVVSKDGNTTFFIEPYSFPRYADSLIADAVNNFSEYEVTQAPLYFQGGNVLIGDTFFLIGADYPRNSLQYVTQGVLNPAQGENPTNFVRRLYKQYMDVNRNLLYVGSRKSVPVQVERTITLNGEPWTEVLYFGNHSGTIQPLFHIDMFITLAGRNNNGKYTLVIGDPKMAFDVLGWPVPEGAMVEVFDSVADLFITNGFNVVRNPIPLVYGDDESNKRREWYFATSNNALVEIYDSTKRVFLPTYGHGSWPELAATDAKNKEIWEKLGFTVVQLEDFHPFASGLGAVHCIKKYLKRG